jgi:outer membrane biosynthesis protein TonB
MSASRLNENPLHPAEHLLRWAFVISIIAHLAIYGAFQLGHRYGWWKKDLVPTWFKPKQTLTQLKKELAHPVAPQQPQLVFVDVDPTVVAAPPKDAKYYSSHNSQASNPDITIDSNTPKIDGTQTHVPKTQSAPRAKAVPLQPAPPPKAAPAEQEVAAESKPKPKGGPAVGDLALAKPAPQPGDGQVESDTGQSDSPAPVHQRPRTIAEAKARQAISSGEKMKMEGGVKRRLDVDSTLDAIATPFGEYDREVIEAIKFRWETLLDSKSFSRDRTGRVVVEFNLNSDGRVTDLHVVESDVGDLLSYVCKSAIIDPAPFAPWPTDMRRFLGTDVRSVRFAFYYE